MYNNLCFLTMVEKYACKMMMLYDKMKPTNRYLRYPSFVLLWKVLKVKNAQVRGQTSMKFDNKRHRRVKDEWFFGNGREL